MKKQTLYRISIVFALLFAFVSCNTKDMPEKAKAVTDFDVNRYLGTWYEIARFDFRFEKDLDNTSAQYSLDANGDVLVLNSGFHTKEKEWKKAEGKAKFRGNNTQGALKVSFFGPFYSGYTIVALDADYNYALIAGKNLDYLWILSREKTIPTAVKEEYLAIAQEIGYDTSRLLWINHDKDSNPFLNEGGGLAK
ncbi:lipocalin family protein [Myroides sp. C8-3]|uniref:lipocalin family protein n=1 Tax=Myroides sp. C8-3 TaxID=3400533 RepID=UPI003D2F8553